MPDTPLTKAELRRIEGDFINGTLSITIPALVAEFRRLRADLKQAAKDADYKTEVLVATRDFLSSVQKQLGIVPTQNAYSAKMAEGEMNTARAVADLNSITERPDPDWLKRVREREGKNG